MSQWIKNDLGIISTGEIESVVDKVQTVVDPVVTVLQVALAVLDVISFFVTEIPDALKLIVEAAIVTLEKMLTDLLQNNASAAVHVNLNWNPHWKWKKKKGDPNRIVDFVNDSQLPFHGSGTVGWLLDLGSAAYDESNVFRPFSDDDSAVTGVIFIKGVPLNGDLRRLKPLFDAFTDVGPFKDWLDVAEKLTEEPPPLIRALLRLGGEGLNSEEAKVHRSFKERAGATAMGTLIAQGYQGENGPGATEFKDNTIPFADVRSGDTLSISGSAGVYKILRVPAFGNKLELTTPILRAHGGGTPASWARWSVFRGGMASLLSELPTTAGSFERLVPGVGNLPVWYSVPLAGLLPPVGALMEALRRLLNGLKPGVSPADLLRQLIAILQEKIRLLQMLIKELVELIKLALALVEFFDETYMVQISGSSGGVAAFLNAAIAADDMPFFGTEGVVAGVTFLTVTDNPSNHLQDFFEMVGVKFDSVIEGAGTATAGVSAAAKARQDTWDEYYL